MLLMDKPYPGLDSVVKRYSIVPAVINTGQPDEHKRSRVLKTQTAIFCPYDPCAFIDADTLLINPIDAFWQSLESAPLAMTISQQFPTIESAGSAKEHMSKPNYFRDFHCTVKCTGPTWPHYHSALMVWRRTPEVLNLFEVWHKEWFRHKGCDMFPLARALYTTALPVSLLPRHFSVRASALTPNVIVLSTRINNIGQLCRRYFPDIFKEVTKLLAVSSKPIRHKSIPSPAIIKTRIAAIGKPQAQPKQIKQLVAERRERTIQARRDSSSRQKLQTPSTVTFTSLAKKTRSAHELRKEYARAGYAILRGRQHGAGK
jgi:hypothetical protein